MQIRPRTEEELEAALADIRGKRCEDRYSTSRDFLMRSGGAIGALQYALGQITAEEFVGELCRWLGTDHVGEYDG